MTEAPSLSRVRRAPQDVTMTGLGGGDRTAGVPGARPDPAGIDLANIFAGRRHRPVVYFVQIEGGIKIGTTRNLQKRMDQLGCHLSWVLLVVPGDRFREAAYHRQFQAERLRGDREWFRCRGELRRFLAPVLPKEPPADTRSDDAGPLQPASAGTSQAGGTEPAEQETQTGAKAQLSVEPAPGPEPLSLTAIARRLTAEGTPIKPALLSTHKLRRADFPRPVRTVDGRDWYAYGDIRAYYRAREQASAQPSDEPIPGPEPLSLTAIAQRLTAEGVPTKPGLLRMHKLRHRDFPPPVRTVDGRDWYTYDDVLAYYRARAEAAMAS
ncbi:GIY-YIG nuclease family protein [Streptacidiphilus sp. EB103A]|uniref:GIY-YIG nuclease family protein n=1 Tax=Streptacidiphilus sp. EB103A TaxID=3156275 RepID=UPI00351921FF